MNTSKIEINNISDSTNLNSSFDDIDLSDKEIPKYKYFTFIILLVIIILLFIFSILIIVYRLIIKPESDESTRKIHPEYYISLRERNKIDKFVENCMKGILLDEKKYPKLEAPKISIIIPVYNKENFILKILRSIQNQSFKDIEIIFCDDNSKDNSTKLIEKYQKEDERIILLKHEINQGTLRTRIDGFNISKGEYILFVDPDDLLMPNILKKIYVKAKKNNIDIVQFQSYQGDYYKNFIIPNTNRSTEPIYQPQLSNLMYYEKGYLEQTEVFIWGKLIRRTIFIEVLKSIDSYYLNQHMTLHEDGLTLFILFKKANSYLFINDYGTLYFYNKYSTLNNVRKEKNINKTIKNYFLYLEFMFHYTNDTLHDKNMAVAQFKTLLSLFINDIFKKMTNGFKYVYKVIDLYLNCNIILKEDKKIIQNLKNEIKIIESNLTSLLI